MNRLTRTHFTFSLKVKPAWHIPKVKVRGLKRNWFGESADTYRATASNGGMGDYTPTYHVRGRPNPKLNKKRAEIPDRTPEDVVRLIKEACKRPRSTLHGPPSGTNYREMQDFPHPSILKKSSYYPTVQNPTLNSPKGSFHSRKSRKNLFFRRNPHRSSFYSRSSACRKYSGRNQKKRRRCSWCPLFGCGNQGPKGNRKGKTQSPRNSRRSGRLVPGRGRSMGHFHDRYASRWSHHRGQSPSPSSKVSFSDEVRVVSTASESKVLQDKWLKRKTGQSGKTNSYLTSRKTNLKSKSPTPKVVKWQRIPSSYESKDQFSPAPSVKGSESQAKITFKGGIPAKKKDEDANTVHVKIRIGKNENDGSDDIKVEPLEDDLVFVDGVGSTSKQIDQNTIVKASLVPADTKIKNDLGVQPQSSNLAPVLTKKDEATDTADAAPVLESTEFKSIDIVPVPIKEAGQPTCRSDGCFCQGAKNNENYLEMLRRSTNMTQSQLSLLEKSVHNRLEPCEKGNVVSTECGDVTVITHNSNCDCDICKMFGSRGYSRQKTVTRDDNSAIISKRIVRVFHNGNYRNVITHTEECGCNLCTSIDQGNLDNNRTTTSIAFPKGDLLIRDGGRCGCRNCKSVVVNRPSLGLETVLSDTSSEFENEIDSQSSEQTEDTTADFCFYSNATNPSHQSFPKMGSRKSKYGRSAPLIGEDVPDGSPGRTITTPPLLIKANAGSVEKQKKVLDKTSDPTVSTRTLGDMIDSENVRRKWGMNEFMSIIKEEEKYPSCQFMSQEVTSKTEKWQIQPKRHCSSIDPTLKCSDKDADIPYYQLSSCSKVVQRKQNKIPDVNALNLKKRKPINGFEGKRKKLGRYKKILARMESSSEESYKPKSKQARDSKHNQGNQSVTAKNGKKFCTKRCSSREDNFNFSVPSRQAKHYQSRNEIQQIQNLDDAVCLRGNSSNHKEEKIVQPPNQWHPNHHELKAHGPPISHHRKGERQNFRTKKTRHMYQVEKFNYYNHSTPQPEIRTHFQSLDQPLACSQRSQQHQMERQLNKQHSRNHERNCRCRHCLNASINSELDSDDSQCTDADKGFHQLCSKTVETSRNSDEACSKNILPLFLRPNSNLTINELKQQSVEGIINEVIAKQPYTSLLNHDQKYSVHLGTALSEPSTKIKIVGSSKQDNCAPSILAYSSNSDVEMAGAVSPAPSMNIISLNLSTVYFLKPGMNGTSSSVNSGDLHSTAIIPGYPDSSLTPTTVMDEAKHTTEGSKDDLVTIPHSFLVKQQCGGGMDNTVKRLALVGQSHPRVKINRVSTFRSVAKRMTSLIMQKWVKTKP